jgi:hypothetical protein
MVWYQLWEAGGQRKGKAQKIKVDLTVSAGY